MIISLFSSRRPSPDVVRVIKFRRLRKPGYVVRMEEGNCAFKILTRIPTGKRLLCRHIWQAHIRNIKGVNTRNFI